MTATVTQFHMIFNPGPRNEVATSLQQQGFWAAVFNEKRWGGMNFPAVITNAPAEVLQQAFDTMAATIDAIERPFEQTQSVSLKSSDHAFKLFEAWTQNNR